MSSDYDVVESTSVDGPGDLPPSSPTMEHPTTLPTTPISTHQSESRHEWPDFVTQRFSGHRAEESTEFDGNASNPSSDLSSASEVDEHDLAAEHDGIQDLSEFGDNFDDYRIDFSNEGHTAQSSEYIEHALDRTTEPLSRTLLDEHAGDAWLRENGFGSASDHDGSEDSSDEESDADEDGYSTAIMHEDNFQSYLGYYTSLTEEDEDATAMHLSATHRTARQFSLRTALHESPVAQGESDPLPRYADLLSSSVTALHDRPVVQRGLGHRRHLAELFPSAGISRSSSSPERLRDFRAMRDAPDPVAHARSIYADMVPLYPHFSGNWSLYQPSDGSRFPTPSLSDSLEAFTDGLEVLNECETAGQDCGICLLGYDDENKDYGAAVCLPCHRSHACHRDCIRTWLEQSPTCPHCRKEFPECRDRPAPVEYEYTEHGFRVRR